MRIIETAWKQWFSQFAPYVFTEGELVQDPDNNLYPRITFSYSMGGFYDNTITAFQVWTWSPFNTELWKVCGKIAEEVPAAVGTTIIIPDGGAIEIRRGAPFLTASPKDEKMSRVMYGTLNAHYLALI